MFATLRKLGLLTAGAVALAIYTGSAGAASLTLGNSGWVATWDSSLDDAFGSQVSLTVDGETANSVTIEKFAVFADAVQSDGTIPPISISFQATRPDAAQFIVIGDETVINHTGVTWNGFRFTIQDGNTGTSQDVQFDVGQSAGFSIAPFTTRAYSQNNQILTVDGGPGIPSAPPGVVGPNVWFPGVGPGALVVRADPVQGTLRNFVLKEQPLTVIPVPAAAWTGLTGLVGLAVIGSAKKLRNLIG